MNTVVFFTALCMFVSSQTTFKKQINSCKTASNCQHGNACSNYGDDNNWDCVYADIDDCADDWWNPFSDKIECFCNCQRDCTEDDASLEFGSSCQNSPTTELSSNIYASLGINVASAAAGAVPTVGSMAKVIVQSWEIYYGSSWTSNIEDKLDAAIDYLRNCMDSLISTSKVDAYIDDMNGIAALIDIVDGGAGDTFDDNLRQAFNDITVFISTLFVIPESNYYEYESMLPIFENIVSWYAGISLEYLSKFKYTDNDRTNFDNTVDSIETHLGYLATWLDWAKDSMSDAMEASLEQQPCRNIDAVISNFETNFENTYVANFETIAATLHLFFLWDELECNSGIILENGDYCCLSGCDECGIDVCGGEAFYSAVGRFCDSGDAPPCVTNAA